MESASLHLKALIDEFYEVWLRFHPDAALSAGIQGYEGKMPAAANDDVGALGSWLESTIVGLEEIDFHSLELARQVDMELLFGACRDEYQAILECDWRHRDPVAFMPFKNICRLALDSDISGYAALEACLKVIPEFLYQARSRLTEYPELIPRLWVDAALGEGQAGVRFLRQLADRDGAPSGLQAQCDLVSRALSDYLSFLSETIEPQADGAAACGWQRFQEQLRFRHHLPDKLGDQLEVARRIYQETNTELGMLCLEQTGSIDPRVWLEKLNCRDRLQGDQKLQYTRQRSSEIHRLLAESGQFRLPETASFELLSAPEGYPVDCEPLYRPTGSSGRIYLEQAAKAETPERLTAWCIRNVWPGRHLQAAIAADSPLASALVRRLNISASQQVGWSLYAEQLVQELAFFPAPEQVLQSLLERLRRSLMAVLDIELHVHGMAASGALLQMQALPGRSAEDAARDLLSLTRQPTQHLAGVVGWKQLAALRQWQLSSGDLELADFHALLLSQGCVAAPLVIRRVFGAQAWDWVEQQIYSQ